MSAQLDLFEARRPSLQGLFWCVLPSGMDEIRAIEAATRKALEAGYEEVRDVSLREHLIHCRGTEAWWVLVATVEAA